MRKHRYFSPEFKDRVVAELLSGKLSQTKLASKYDIHDNLIYNWKKAYISKNGKAKKAYVEVKASQLELALKKTLAEAEILSKAIEILNRRQ